MQYTEGHHLRDKEPVVTAMCQKLINELQKFGEIKIEPKKTSTHLGNRLALLGLYPK